MSSQNYDTDGYEEKCSICERVLKKGEGRFRMSDQVLCLECHDANRPPVILEVEKKGE